MKPISEMTPDEIRALIALAPKTPEERYTRASDTLRSAEGEYERWCALGAAAKTAVWFDRDDEARDYSKELARLAPRYKDDWNYGNAIQDFNIVFGLLSLKAGDSDSARRHLLEAGRSPGSPQMDSFGPNMSLAKALLDHGHPDVVLDYFDLCRRFWEMHRGRLDEWTHAVNTGSNPDFKAFLIY
jgi:hypothetical protein